MSKADEIFNRVNIIKELVDDLTMEVAKLPTNYLNVPVANHRNHMATMRELLDTQAKLAQTIQLFHAKVG